MSDLLTDLLNRPAEARDADWQAAFFDAVANRPLAVGDPPVFIGPDGFSYFALFTSEAATTAGSTTLAALAVRATEEGFGAALNPREDGADWVFSYGDLLALRMFGTIQVMPYREFKRHEVIQHQEQVLVGAPSSEVVPPYVRPHLSRFLRAAGVARPGIILMDRPSADPPQQLFFNARPSHFPSEAAFSNFMSRLTWFFPRHYAIMSKDRDDLPYVSLDDGAPIAARSEPAPEPPPKKRWFQFWR